MLISDNPEEIKKSINNDYPEINISNSTLLVLNFLVKEAITHYLFIFPSVKYIVGCLKNDISSLTVKRAVKVLDELGIVQKYPRSTTQPVALDINNCLFRFILAVNQPNLELQEIIQNSLNEELDDSFLQQLITNRKHLENLIENLTNKDETVQDLCEHFFENFPTSIINEHSLDTLEDRMRETVDWFVGDNLLSLPDQIRVFNK